MQVECGVYTPAITSFSVLENPPPEAYYGWISEHQKEIRQSLSAEDETRTSAYFTEKIFFNIKTELGKERDSTAVLTSLALKGSVNPHLFNWGINYRRSLTGPWMAEQMERALRHGQFYQMDILPPGYGIRFKSYDLSLAEEPLTILITPFGEITRVTKNQVISVYSPLEAIFSQNNNGQHPS